MTPSPRTASGRLAVVVAALALSSWTVAQEADGAAPLQRGATAATCGAALMSAQQRSEHRERMRGARSAAEREQLQHEHHEAMLARAKERGAALADPGCPGHGAQGHRIDEHAMHGGMGMHGGGGMRGGTGMQHGGTGMQHGGAGMHGGSGHR